MSRISITAITCALAFAPAIALACSPAIQDELQVDSSFAYEGERAPDAPVVTAMHVARGDVDADGADCAGAGEVEIAIRDDSPRSYYGYSFEQVSGLAPDLIFPGSGYFLLGSPRDGSLMFYFHWADELVKDRSKKIDVVVRITAKTASGVVGTPTEVRVVEGTKE